MRVNMNVPRHRRIKKIRKAAKGYFLGRKNFQQALDQIEKARGTSLGHRRAKARDMRGLWIIRINAACRERGISYSKFMDALKKKQIAINRKMLADMAYNDPAAFDAVMAAVKQ